METDTAASIVFQPLKQLGDVAYQVTTIHVLKEICSMLHFQFRYISKDGTKPIETVAYTENEMR